MGISLRRVKPKLSLTEPAFLSRGCFCRARGLAGTTKTGHRTRLSTRSVCPLLGPDDYCADLSNGTSCRLGCPKCGIYAPPDHKVFMRALPPPWAHPSLEARAQCTHCKRRPQLFEWQCICGEAWALCPQHGRDVRAHLVRRAETVAARSATTAPHNGPGKDCRRAGRVAPPHARSWATRRWGSQATTRTC